MIIQIRNGVEQRFTKIPHCLEQRSSYRDNKPGTGVRSMTSAVDIQERVKTF